MTDIAPDAAPLEEQHRYEVVNLGSIHRVNHRVEPFAAMHPFLYLERDEIQELAAVFTDYIDQLRGYEKVDTTVGELLRYDIIRGLDVAVNVSHVEHTSNGGVAVYSIDLGHFATFKQSSFPITILRKIS